MSEIKIFFRRNPDFKMMPVSGVWGGLTPQGNVYCDFFFEKAEIPENVVMEVGEGAVPAKEVGRNPQTQMFIREVVVGLSMQPEIARSIGQWLIDKADEFKKRALGGKA